jgi:DNA polymerase-1
MCTWPLWPQLEQDDKLRFVYQLEMDSSETLYRIERNGVLIDAPTLATQSHELGQRIMALEKEGLRAGRPAVQPGQPQTDWRNLLHQAGPAGESRRPPPARPAPTKKCWRSWPKTTRCRPKSWSTAAWPSSRAPTPTSWPSWRNPRTGRVHTHYAQAVAVTGRLSSNDPNLQNIPIRTAEGRRVREAFVAPAGLCDCQRRLQPDRAAHHGPHQRRRGPAQGVHEGMDVHRATAAEVFGVPPEQVSSEQRRYAKVINFGLIYGMSAFGLARAWASTTRRPRTTSSGTSSALPASNATWTRRASRPRTRAMWKPCSAAGCTCPRSTHPTARAQRCRARRHQRAHAGHGGRPDQAEHERGAAGAGQRTRGTKMIMQVHDELVFEVPESEVDWLKTEIPRLMAGVAALKVPLLAEVGVGLNWDKAH